MNRKMVLFAVAVVALVVAIAIWWMKVSTSAPVDVASTANGMSRSEDVQVKAPERPITRTTYEVVVEGDATAIVELPQTTSTVPTLASLPPLLGGDQPLALQLDGLLARARAGDGEAACRLVIEGERCRRFAARSSFLKNTEHIPLSESEAFNKIRVELAARAAEAVATEGTHCDNLDLRTLPDVDESLEHALNGLTVRQKVVLAMSRTDGTVARIQAEPDVIMGGDFNVGQPLVAQFYADHVVDFLAEGVAAGELLAIEGMVLLHQPTSNPRGHFGLQLALPDPYRFALYRSALLALGGPATRHAGTDYLMSRAISGMSPERRKRLDAEVESLLRHVRTARQSETPSPPVASANHADLCAD